MLLEFIKTLVIASKTYKICIACAVNAEHTIQSKNFLTSDETARYNSITNNKIKLQYLLGRYCVKKSIAKTNSDFNKISVINDSLSAPYIKNATNTYVSITHKNNIAASIIFNIPKASGIDLEIINHKKYNILKKKNSEIDQNDDIKMLTIAWSAKEALSKSLLEGFSANFHKFEIKSIHQIGCLFVVLFKNFPKHTVICIAKNKIVLCLCINSECN